MYDKVCEDIKEAMKAKEKDRLETLRMLKSKFIENKTSTAPVSEDEVVISYCKKLKESLPLFPEGSPQQEKLKAEIAYLAPYLPKELTEAEVKGLIDQIMAHLKASGQQNINFGLIMKELSPQIRGKFDGARASALAKTYLS